MIKKKNLRRLLEGRVQQYEGRSNSPARDGRRHFIGDVRVMLGLAEEIRDKDGNHVEFLESRDEFDRPRFAEGRARPTEFSLRTMAEAVCGEQLVEEFFGAPTGQGNSTLLETGGGGAIDPTAFLNINTFSLATGGLIEAKILEEFQNPAFIGDQLVETVPTTKNGEKIIGVGGISAEGTTRFPGQPHARTGFGEHYVTTPELVEKGLAVELTREAVFHDLTGQVLQRAAGVGEALGYGREKTLADLVLGVTNPYVYNGSAHNTYQTSTPWINDHVNIPVDYTDLDVAAQLFANMTDPTTGHEILVNPTTMLVMPPKMATWNRILNSTEIRETTATNTVTISPTPVRTQFTVLASPIWFNRVKAADGLNISDAADAADYWWQGEFKKAFKWMEARPLTTTPAQADSYVMIDRGLIASYFSNYRGIGAVVQPRYVIRNKHS